MENDKIIPFRAAKVLCDGIKKSAKQTKTNQAGFMRAALAHSVKVTLSGRAEIVNGELQIKGV